MSRIIEDYMADEQPKASTKLVDKVKSFLVQKPSELIKSIDPQNQGSPYNLPLVRPKIDSFEGYNLDFHFAVLTDPSLSPLTLPAGLNSQATGNIRPTVPLLLRDINSVNADAAAFINNGVIFRDNRGTRLMQDQAPVRQNIASPLQIPFWYDSPRLNIYAEGAYEFQVNLTNGVANTNDSYFAFASLLSHENNPLVDPKFRKDLYAKSIPFFWEATINYTVAGQVFGNTTVQINRHTVITGAVFTANLNEYLVSATSGADNKSIGITSVGNPVPIELMAQQAQGNFMQWPGCYYIAPKDAFSIATTKYANLGVNTTVRLTFFGRQF